MPREFFADLLEGEFGELEAQAQLTTAVNWGRYAEMFAYDPVAEEFYLEDPEQAPEGTLAGGTEPE
jgi:NitT/TauT family transport system ATP-binding protein